MRARFALALLGCCLLTPTVTQAGTESTDVRARLNYMQYCSGCHVADGRGAPDKGVPSMRDGVLKRFLSTPEGKAYLVSVPGVTNTPLDVASTTRLMNWLVRSFGDVDVEPSPFQDEDIARGRAHKLSNPEQTRAALLR